jgi:hypothetical protein
MLLIKLWIRISVLSFLLKVLYAFLYLLSFFIYIYFYPCKLIEELSINILTLHDNYNIKKNKKLRTLSIKRKKKWKLTVNNYSSSFCPLIFDSHVSLSMLWDRESLRNSSTYHLYLLLITIEIEEFKLPSLPIIYQIISLNFFNFWLDVSMPKLKVNWF